MSLKKICFSIALLASTSAHAQTGQAKRPLGTMPDYSTTKYHKGKMQAIPKSERTDVASGKFTVTVGGLTSGQPISDTYSYCQPNGSGGTVPGNNISPSVNWVGAPSGTQSYALIMVDKDVPQSFDKANRPGEKIDANAPRQNFYHWVVVDIPASINGILEGKDSRGVVEGGKPFGRTEYGRVGQNDYARFYQGSFGGYDGPCPPWNDERMHNYHFIVYALDIPRLNLPNPVTGQQAEIAMKGHILGQTEIVGTFTNNPDWRAKLRR